MSNSIDNLVYVEVDNRMHEMADLKTTDEAYKATADVTLKFIDRATKMRELEIQAEANKLKREELEENKKRRIADTIIRGFDTVGKFAVPMGMAIGLTVLERTDILTGTATKKACDKIFRLG